MVFSQHVYRMKGITFDTSDHVAMRPREMIPPEVAQLALFTNGMRTGQTNMQIDCCKL